MKMLTAQTIHCAVRSALFLYLAGAVMVPEANAAHRKHHHHSADTDYHRHHAGHSAWHATRRGKHRHRQLSAARRKGALLAAGAGSAVVSAQNLDGREPPASSAIPPAVQQEAALPSPLDKGTSTGLPLPRFATLRADRVYLRRGPGERYPIDWVYHRRGLPVKVGREFDVWRLVEDSDGVKGWVHQATLSGGRTFVVSGPGIPAGAPPTTEPPAVESPPQAGKPVERSDPRVIRYVPTQTEARSEKDGVLLMNQASSDSDLVAVLKPGTVGAIKACPAVTPWCHVVVKGYDGWLPRRSLWGIFPDETIQSN